MAEEEQQQQQQLPSSYQTPYYQYGSSILFLTNPENELHKLELTLRGMQEDEKGMAQSIGEPLLNQKGVSEIIGMTQSIVNQVTILSSLNKDDIDTLRDFLGDTLAKDLMVNRRRYDIKNESTRDQIYFSTISTSFICMKRAQSDTLSDKKFWRGSVQEIHSSVNTNEKKKGILSKINPWNK